MSNKLNVEKLIKGGLFSIFGSSIINKGILFISNIILVKLMTKNDYGNYSYAQNALNLFMLMSGLGTTAAIMQFRSEGKNEELKNDFTKLGYFIGILSNIFLSFLILIVGCNELLTLENSNIYLVYLFLVPMFLLIIDYIFVVLRSERENNKFAILTMINGIVTFIATISGLHFYNSYIMIIFRYIAYFITILIGLYMIKDYIKINFKIKLSKIEIKEFVIFSLITSASNLVSQFILYIDTFLIGMLIINPDITANYKVATTIPLNLTFIPTSIITFIYPYFAMNKDNITWIKKNTYKLIYGLIILNIFICGSLIVFAPFIIKVLFGAEYLTSVYTFRILILGFFIQSTFRMPLGNILVMLRMVDYNLLNSIISGIANILLNIILIKEFNDVGAAYSKLFTFILSSIIGFILFKKYIKDTENNYIKEIG